MKPFRFRTASGSLYEINPIAKTWARLEFDSAVSPFVRTKDGEYKSISEVAIGKPVHLIGESLTSGGLFRLIETTPVTEIITQF